GARGGGVAGPRRALASERSYLRSALPRRVGRSLADAVRGELAGLGSVLAILAAVAAAGGGYLAGGALGGVRDLAHRTPRPAGIRPQRVRIPAALSGWSRLAFCLALWVGAGPAAAVSRKSRSLAAAARDRLAELTAVLVILTAVTVAGAAFLSQGT